MEFIEVVKGLSQGKVFKREAWEGLLEFKYLVKDEYGVLKLFGFGRLDTLEITQEDVLADDWFEAKKEQYILKKVHEEKDGMRYYTLEESEYALHDLVLSEFELKPFLSYITLEYEAEFNEMIQNLISPTIEPFDYNFRKCPLCETKIEFDDVNWGKCVNGCISYDVDPQGEDVIATLFDNEYKEEDSYLINLYENAWRAGETERIVDLKKFQEAILYWKEKERYKKRLSVEKQSE